MVMTKVFYERVGKRYRPVLEYDREVMDSFPPGDHLVSVRSGCTSRRYNINPTLAPMIAAGLYAKEAIVRQIHEATELKPVNREIDEETQRRWRKFIETMPEEFRYLFTHGSAVDAADAGIAAMQEEVDRMMTNPAVRQAYEQFLLVCELSRKQDV